MPDNRHIVDVIYINLHVADLPWYNICIVLQIVENLFLFLTIFIRYKAEMKHNRHIIDAIYTCTFWSLFIDRIESK